MEGKTHVVLVLVINLYIAAKKEPMARFYRRPY